MGCPALRLVYIHFRCVFCMHTKVWGDFLGLVYIIFVLLRGPNRNFPCEAPPGLATAPRPPPNRPPQVPVSFTRPSEFGESPRGAAQKALNSRHAAWVRRFSASASASAGRQASWRPKPLKRVSAKHWLDSKDNMIRVGSSWAGLSSVVPRASDEWAEGSWSSWRHLQLCMDRGPDGVCAGNCLLYSPDIRANVTCWFDESHDLENDLYGVYQDQGLYPFMLVMCVVMNLGHGCERDRDLRYWQFADLLKFVFEHFQPSSCASFQMRCSEILGDLGDKVPMDGSAQPAEALWEFEKSRAPRPYLYERVNMVRFLSWPAAGRELLREWSSLLWKVELLCVECDWVSSAQFKTKIALRTQQLVKEETERGSTSASIPSIDGKVVRQACQNAVVIALSLLEEESHKILLAIMVHVAQPVLDFRKAHAQMCRDSAGTLTWAANLINGGLMEQAHKVFSLLGSVQENSALGFQVEVEDGIAPVDPRIQGEDEWATLLGNHVVSLVGRRLTQVVHFRFASPTCSSVRAPRGSGSPLGPVARGHGCEGHLGVAARHPFKARLARALLVERHSGEAVDRRRGVYGLEGSGRGGAAELGEPRS